ncbi:hypothetical protein L596_016541 [Steinernema carpocapsae]|uniref:Uncharacterized protein n=1 Tax=Steinernema carpocapsae TaxID=34508 RepID=A0A4U5NI93_STECR|nr:hypothetical protein L596_016541 [Steinernema carpocapsae]
MFNFASRASNPLDADIKVDIATIGHLCPLNTTTNSLLLLSSSFANGLTQVRRGRYSISSSLRLLSAMGRGSEVIRSASCTARSLAEVHPRTGASEEREVWEV